MIFFINKGLNFSVVRWHSMPELRNADDTQLFTFIQSKIESVSFRFLIYCVMLECPKLLCPILCGIIPPEYFYDMV